MVIFSKATDFIQDYWKPRINTGYYALKCIVDLGGKKNKQTWPFKIFQTLSQKVLALELFLFLDFGIKTVAQKTVSQTIQGDIHTPVDFK